MVIEPKIRGFICTTAHPIGCYQNVLDQIKLAENNVYEGFKKVLVIGASTGYGLSSRIVTQFGMCAKTIGVFFEREPTDKKPATAGWYNSKAFEVEASKRNLYAKNFNGDAFSNELKQDVFNTIEKDWGGEVDLVIYSLASPKRKDPYSGKVFSSVLKPIGKTFSSRTVDAMSQQIRDVTIEPANEEEVQDTIKVMGGEDWQMWIEGLLSRNLLAEEAKTIAYSYIGPEVTYDIYRSGTIGKAKEHLENTAKSINEKLQSTNGGQAVVSVNKALVTQASSAIPVVPLYMSILFKVMKTHGLHEGCIEQMCRLFKDKFSKNKCLTDKNFLIRMDDFEMREDIQKEVTDIWAMITEESLAEYADIQEYSDQFFKLFGFKVANVEYDKDVDLMMPHSPEHQYA